MPMSEFDGMPSSGSRIVVHFVSPGGVICKPFAEGYAAMRIGLAHMYDCDDGLREEMEAGRPPVPWENAAARQQALDDLASLRDDAPDDDERDLMSRLIEHVRRTPYYESG
jgi:hypothetical protein